jgi:hypothetical protein
VTQEGGSQVKHADLIRAALDGKKIQFRATINGHLWTTFITQNSAVAWLAGGDGPYEFRLEPEPKPDVVRYGRACNMEYKPNGWAVAGNCTYWTREKSGTDTIKAIFDGETGKLKSVEIV